jgi:hypothetical protein
MKRPAELCADNATNFQVLCQILKTLPGRGREARPSGLVASDRAVRSSEALGKMLLRCRRRRGGFADDSVAPIERVLGHIEDGLWVSHGGLVAARRSA